MEKKTIGGIVAAVLGGAVVGGAGVAGVTDDSSAVADMQLKVDGLLAEKAVLEAKLAEKPLTVEVPVEKIVTETVEVPVEVTVDNGNLDSVLEFVYDRDGDVEFITKELKENEIESIVDAISFFNDAVTISIDEVKSELADELDKEVVGGVTLDEDDIDSIRVDDDVEDIEVISYNHDDKDIKLKLTGKFSQDDDDFTFEAEVRFKDGEFDTVDFDNVVKV